MKKLLTVAALASTRWLSYAAETQNTNAVAETASVTVYASRIDDSREAIPAAVSVFTADDIAASGAQSLPELLAKKANIDIRTMNANPTQSQIAMRGFGENSFGRVKVMMDGEELNAVEMDPPNLARIPLGSVERVEIIHGPSPVLYGDGAVAGVVNVITDTRDYERKTRITGKAGSQGSFGGNVQTKGGSEEDGVQYSAAYDYLTSDGYRRNSAYDLHVANAAVRKNFENGSTIGVKANYGNVFYEMPGSLTHDQWKNSRRSSASSGDWARRWNYGLGIDSKFLLAEDQWLMLDASFSRTYREAKWRAYALFSEYDLYGYSLSPRYVNEKAVFGFDNKFTVGSDLRYDRYKVKSYPSGRKTHFDRMRYAAFIHDEFFATDELSFIAGARLENINNRWSGATGLVDDDSSDWMGDYELGLVYRPVDGVKTYVKGTRFHRSAFCDEMNYTADGRLLEPETGCSLDIGLECEFLKEFTFDVNGYGMIMEDEIFYDPYAQNMGFYWMGYNCNSPAKTRRIGLDTGLSWKRDKVAEASLRYGIVQADFGGGQYHGDEVPLVPNHRIRLEVGVWILDDLEVKGGYRYLSSQYLAGDFGNEHEELPASSLFDVGVYYAPSWADGWKASFVMDNVFDRNACDFAGWPSYAGAYYYPSCGRSFMFTVSYEF